MIEENKKEKTLDASMEAAQRHYNLKQVKNGALTLFGLTILFIVGQEAGDQLSEHNRDQEKKKQDKERWEAEKPLRDAQLQEMMKYSKPR
jgi:hypothetical protein